MPELFGYINPQSIKINPSGNERHTHMLGDLHCWPQN
jgi:hypothetical protein